MYPEITTQRTFMRLISIEDLEPVAKLNANPDVRKFFPDGIQSKSQTKQRIFQFQSYYKDFGLPCFVVFDKSTGNFIGRCGFGPLETGEVEVGYLIIKDLWGQGYATEILNALLNWCCENISTDYIVALAPLKHTASHRVMEKCGMEYYKEEQGYGVSCKYYRYFLNNEK
ncbi:GNAT family N-acetyltransferase [Legionella yabuuchiae]|uniref:GNAT family N-acetyltransferase n=1 Tax=Legionella yabuuchiae TaxID=376727 RepID=UPI001054C396|nr:GNAT family N-acetyltransferase [Legionella yabuuchiae]